MNEIITKQSLDVFAVQRMRSYGKEVIEQRALPDFRDGLKPVQRRAMWAALEMGLHHTGGFKKSARLVGDIMGKYHPHGDSSIYKAMVAMANMPQNLLDGEGSYGNLNTREAAMRYTECRLSAYGEKVLLAPDYINVTELVPNYDGEFVEPIVLPALMPNLLLNGAFGMAVGVVTGIPPFTIKSVLKCLKRALEQGEVSEAFFNKNLELNFKYGGELFDHERMRIFVAGGESSITIMPNYTFDKENNKITITGGGPHANDKIMVEALQQYDIVTKVENYTSNKIHIVAYLQDTVEASVGVPKLMKKLADNLTLRLNLTERLSPSDPRYTIHNEVEFFSTTLAQFISKWLKYRLDLEVRAQNNIAANLNKQMHRISLLIMAAENLDKIFKILKKRKDVTDQLIAEFKISKEDADYLGQRPIRSYSVLNTEKMREDLKKLKKDQAIALAIAKSPNDKVLSTSMDFANQFS